jgi:hypothetical protein
MSRTPPSAVSRPTFIDYFFILIGCCLSLYVTSLSPIAVKPRDEASDARTQDLIRMLPLPLRLTEGIILMWPIFFVGQWVRGRWEGLTSAEWLWVFAWFGVALLTGLAAWETWGGGSIPGFLQPLIAGRFRPRYLWYLIFVPALGVLAALFLLGGLMGRGEAYPWTHPFSLTLNIWPVVPLAVIWTMGQFD